MKARKHNERKNFTIGIIQKLADYFGVLKSDIDTTFKQGYSLEEWQDSNIPNSNEITNTVSVMNKLEKPRQEKVLTFAKSKLEEQNKVVDITEFQYDYYDNAVSAGTSQFIGATQKEQVKLPVEFNADYVVPICGDSMEPEYHHGDYIFVNSTVNVSDGEIGIFELSGEAYVKQLIIEDDHAYLHSLNPEYKDMLVDADSDFRVLGRVIGRYSE